MLKYVALALCLATNIARADQCAWVTPAQAQAAVRALPHGVDYLEYCEPCGDAQPTVVAKVDKAAVQLRDRHAEVSINGADVDLAYVFVKRDKDYVNLAAVAGCKTTSVSKSITYPVVAQAGKLAPWYGRFGNGKSQIVLKEQDVQPLWVGATITMIAEDFGDQRAELTGYLHTDEDVPTFATPFKGCSLAFILDGDRLVVHDTKKCNGMMATVLGTYTRESAVR